MKNKKVILEVQGYTSGGSATHTFNLSKFLKKSGFDVYLACPPGSYSSEFTVHGIKSYDVQLKGKFDFQSIQRLCEISKEIEVDIIHTHCRNADLAGLICCALNPNIIGLTTLHGWFGNETGINGGFEVNPFFHSLFLKLFAKRIIAISAAVKDHAIQNYKIPAEKINVVYNGTDEKLFDLTNKIDARHQLREDLGVDEKTICISHVANLYASKRHDIFIEMAKQIINRGRENIHFLIVGDGPESSKLKKLTKDLCLETYIHFLGNRSDVPKILLGSDLAVVCSRWEGFGRGVVEAYAAEIPVVAVRVGAIPELMTGKMGDLLIEEPNPILLAEKILFLCENPYLLFEYGEFGRNLFIEKFTNTDFEKNSLQVINSLF